MAEQLFQIGIKALIRDKSGNILMLHAPQWGSNPEHWDLPGGRMDPGETFVQTLRRELQEEIGVDYTGEPKQLTATLSNITIPVGDIRVSLVLIAYEVVLPDSLQIVLGHELQDQTFGWFSPAKAAELLTVKYVPDFCAMVTAL